VSRSWTGSGSRHSAPWSNPFSPSLAWRRTPRSIGWQPLERAGCAFLDACAAGRSLEQASELALAVQPQLDFNDLLGRLLAAGAFAALVPTTPST